MISIKIAKSKDRTPSRQRRGTAQKKGESAPLSKRSGRSEGAKLVNLRQESKQQACLHLLGRPDGASIQELQQLTGWQAHTVRGFLSAAVKRKLGLKLFSEKAEDCPRRYRLPQATA